jgi:hypothetical protein
MEQGRIGGQISNGKRGQMLFFQPNKKQHVEVSITLLEMTTDIFICCHFFELSVISELSTNDLKK